MPSSADGSTWRPCPGTDGNVSRLAGPVGLVHARQQTASSSACKHTRCVHQIVLVPRALECDSSTFVGNSNLGDRSHRGLCFAWILTFEQPMTFALHLA